MNNKLEKALREICSIDELAERDSPVHRLPPLAKLIVTIAYIAVTVSFHKYDIVGIAVMAVYPVIMFAISGISVGSCFYKLRIILPIVALVGVFNPIFEIHVTKTTEIISLIINCLSVYELSSFLYSNKPYINPDIAVLIVYPIKNAPVGNNVAPIISPRTFNKTVHLAPNHIAHNMLGINAKLIFNIGVFIDKKRDNIISVAKSIAVSIIFLFLDIKNPPFLLFRIKRKGESYSFHYPY